MSSFNFSIRNAKPDEFRQIGKLMVTVYSALEGFPNVDEQPNYYRMLRSIGDLTNKPGVELIVAVNENENLLGAVVYFADMGQYGSGGSATSEENASGFRLLAVAQEARGAGIGKALSCECIERARRDGNDTLIIHTTKAMQTAWQMYEKLGFERALALDFLQEKLPVYGFRLNLRQAPPLDADGR